MYHMNSRKRLVYGYDIRSLNIRKKNAVLICHLTNLKYGNADKTGNYGIIHE